MASRVELTAGGAKVEAVVLSTRLEASWGMVHYQEASTGDRGYVLVRREEWGDHWPPIAGDVLEVSTRRVAKLAERRGCKL